MNKQDLIKKYTAKNEELRPNCPNRNRKNEELKRSIYEEIIEDLEQLDELQKVTVPKFVADWIEQCKENATLADCLDGHYEISNGEGAGSGDFQNWVVDNENDELTAKAWLFGYEVKETATYRVKIGNGYFIKFQSNGCLVSPNETDGIMEFESKQDAERVANKIGGIVVKVDEP